MTRFLSRFFHDFQSAGFNQETERLFAYHQATKHTYRSVRANAHYLDWRNQPDPFRTYEGAPVTVLAPDPGFPDIGTFGAMGALDGRARTGIGTENDSEERDAIRLDAIWLSRLLWHSMAVSAWKKIPRTGDRYSLRVNPSSGNLHPTETYLAVRGFTDVDEGLYHYRADRHALELRSSGGWTEHLAEALLVPWAAESPLILGLTSIFWREAWKYRDRAYRYCCHDLGHAMMSLLLAAGGLGLSGGAVTHFVDSRLMRTLGLNGGDEAPMAFLVFRAKNSSRRNPLVSQQTFFGVPNELSAEEVPYELLIGIHRSTILADSESLPPHLPAANAADVDGQPNTPELSRDPARDSSLSVITRRRRSALDFDARTPPMERGEMEQLLDFATRDWLADWRGNFGGEISSAGKGADFVTLYLYVHRVRDCEPGVYRWDGSSRKLEQLHRGNVERVAAYLSLEQALAGNACFAISMVADLAAAAQVLGNRAYRYVHFEAGAIGQRLYLGAETLGWNATGIGAFYDDDVHRYLGFLEDTEGSVGSSLDAAEKGALVMLGSPTSRHAAVQDRESLEPASEISDPDDDPFSGKRRPGVKEIEADPRRDSSKLPRQVIYHFAVGRAIPDPRLEA
jgi:SagB-type dehydrogenase family enzyme